MVRQQAVPVVVKITDQRHRNAHAIKLLAYRWHGTRCLVVVHRNPNQLGAGLRQFLDLNRRRNGVGGVGVGHGLHPHRRVATHRHDVLTPPHHALQAAPGSGGGHGDGLLESVAHGALT